MAANLMSRVVEFALEYIEEHGRVDYADELRPAIAEEFGQEISQAWEELAYEAIRRKIKNRLRTNEEGDSVMQTRLEGFDLPTAIAVPREGGGVVFVSTLTATRDDAEAQLLLKEKNIADAIHRRDEWDRTLDRLRPAWAVNAEWTIGECIDFLANQP